MFFPRAGAAGPEEEKGGEGKLKGGVLASAEAGQGNAGNGKWGQWKGVHVRPAAGDALVLYNLLASGHREGAVDMVAKVGAAPVLRGEKVRRALA